MGTKNLIKKSTQNRIKDVLDDRNINRGLDLPEDWSTMKVLYSTYKNSAERRGHLFNLTLNQFYILTKGNCIYCGTEPKQVKKVRSSKTKYIYNGIDRLDNTEGYTFENCLPCCGKCNYLKRKDTVFTAIQHSVKIYKHTKLLRRLGLELLYNHLLIE